MVQMKLQGRNWLTDIENKVMATQGGEGGATDSIDKQPGPAA